MGRMSCPHARLLAILDYDGTVTEDDCNDIVLTQAVGDAWLESEQAMQRGEITHTEAFRRQIALLRWPRPQLTAAAVDAARLRPGFRAVLEHLVAGGAHVAVVSVGFRETIQAVWRRESLPPVEVYASELLGDEEQGYRVGFHPLTADCDRCEKCKAGVLRALRRPHHTVVVFGDGEGDFCLAREADVVFARGRLAALCHEAGIRYLPLDGFDRVMPALHRALGDVPVAAGSGA